VVSGKASNLSLALRLALTLTLALSLTLTLALMTAFVSSDERTSDHAFVVQRLMRLRLGVFRDGNLTHLHRLCPLKTR
jgi:hypothetical protein